MIFFLSIYNPDIGLDLFGAVAELKRESPERQLAKDKGFLRPFLLLGTTWFEIITMYISVAGSILSCYPHP
tara:strand:+ start:343 stop:555 length:213 start_codon:yes stop_codon:yes gene_type:complete